MHSTIFQLLYRLCLKSLHASIDGLFACEAGNSIEPGGASPRELSFEVTAREVGESRMKLALSPVITGSPISRLCSWGLRPRLYAVACFAGYTN